MAETRKVSNEEEIWNAYIQTCEKNGKKPTVKDFTEWAKALMRENN